MNEAPERIIADLQAKLTECCLQALATDGQAAEALDRAIKAEAEAATLRGKLAEAVEIAERNAAYHRANYERGEPGYRIEERMAAVAESIRDAIARIAEDAQ